MIHYTCSGCGKEHTIGDEFGGREAKCPGCGQRLVIPVREQGVDAQKVLEGFSGRGTREAAKPAEFDELPVLGTVWKVLGGIVVIVTMIAVMMAASHSPQQAGVILVYGILTGLFF